jgi:hypothetical protein
MSNEPLKSIIQIYDTSVKEADEAGLAEVYKRATDKVFEALKKELKFEITITDIEYLDGYFIFGKGTNSVVHFHIKETPGWKYGIWWSPIEKAEDSKEYYTDRLSCNIFTQYEEEIDKFKPSASIVCEEFTVHLTSPATGCIWEFAQDIEFIHNEPYLAFYREMHYTDFNKEYITRAKAKAYFERHFRQKKLKEEITVLNNREILKTLNEILKEDIAEGTCFIEDRGDSWSPRYEIVAKNLWEVKDGCYNLFDLFEDTEVKSMQKLWDKTIKDCERRMKKAGCYWYSSSCCHNSILLLSAEKYKECFDHANKVDFTKLEDNPSAVEEATAGSKEPRLEQKNKECYNGTSKSKETSK